VQLRALPRNEAGVMSHHTGMLATCETTGKRSYSTRKVAKTAMIRSARDYGETRSEWNAYRCEHCRLFHIGHRTPTYGTTDYYPEEALVARIRTIKPEFWDSPDTEKASAVARLLFIAMWNWADDAGRGSANLKELEGFAFPNDDVAELSGGICRSFRHALAEVRDCFGVLFYKVRGRPFYEIPSWRNHQRNERIAKGKFPAASEGEPWDFMGPDQGRGGTSDTLRRNAAEAAHGSSEAAATSGAGTGEQGNRGTGEEETCAPQAEREKPFQLSLVPAPEKAPEPGSDDDPDWVKFWSVYPLKKSKEAARAKWRAALKKTDAATIIAAAERYRAERNGADPTYTAHPNTWLSQGRWADEPTPQHKPGYQPYQDPDPADYYGAI
jgi:hypothetical protein